MRSKQRDRQSVIRRYRASRAVFIGRGKACAPATQIGMTFGEWRQQARLPFALERLARGARVVDVALDAGYASQSAFTAMFRRHLSVPPNAFYR